MRSIIKNKKAQFEPAIFFVAIILMIIVGIIILYVLNMVMGGMSTAMNSTAPYAVAEGEQIVTLTTNLFDYLIIIGMLVNVILLFISSFFINTHPVFFILYLISAFVLILLAPNVLNAVDQVWAKFPTESAQLPLTDFIRTHMIGFLLGIMILTAIIMYAKFRSDEF